MLKILWYQMAWLWGEGQFEQRLALKENVIWIKLMSTVCRTKFKLSCFKVKRGEVFTFIFLLCSQWLSLLMLWVQILLMARCTQYNIVLLATGWWFSPGSLLSSTNKTDRHNITEILLKVAFNTITLEIFKLSRINKPLYVFEYFYVLMQGKMVSFHAKFNENNIYFSNILYQILL